LTFKFDPHQLYRDVPGANVNAGTIREICPFVDGMQFGVDLYCASSSHRQLTTVMPGTAPYYHMASVCGKLDGYEFSNGAHCIVVGLTQLSDYDLEAGAGTSMYDACMEMSGTPFGADDEFCAVEEGFVQLTTQFVNNPERSSMLDVCDAIGGYLFGEHEQHCAVKGYTQLTTEMPGLGSSSMEQVCLTLDGKVFGDNQQHCAVASKYRQLSTYQVGSPDSEPDSMRDQCIDLGGTPFGNNDQFCAVEGITQLTSMFAGDGVSMEEECTMVFRGIPYGKNKEFCAVSSDYIQLTTYIPGETARPFETQCEAMDGIAYGNNFFCAVKPDNIHSPPPPQQQQPRLH